MSFKPFPNLLQISLIFVCVFMITNTQRSIQGINTEWHMKSN